MTQIFHAIVLASFSAIFPQIHTANILALLTTPFPSHFIWTQPLLHALAARNHQLTVLSPFPELQPGPNRFDIRLENVYETAQEEFKFSSYVKDTPLKSLLSFFNFVEAMQVMNERGLESNGSKYLLNSTEQFDLIITDLTYGECFLGFAHKFGNPPVIGIVPYGINLWGSDVLGSPETPSYMPHALLPFDDEMTIGERIVNFVVHLYSPFYYGMYQIPLMDRLSRKYFGEKVPSSTELGRNISLILTNTHFSIDYPRAMVPAMIPVGGMHNKPAKPLPQDIRKFLDESKDGAIYFSLGSNVRSDKMNADKVHEFIAAFRNLPQRVLWKWESDTTPFFPPNVMVGKWMPQNDILGHPNVKLFITHGGVFSLQEAVYHAVPLLAIPVFGDQHNQAQKVVRRGIGLKLDFCSLTRETLTQAVKEIFDNYDGYHENVSRISKLFRDQPQPPLDQAVYWTEYVLEHKGAPHLHSKSADLPWYTYFALDVIVLLLVPFAFTLYTFYALICLVVRHVFKITKEKSE